MNQSADDKTGNVVNFHYIKNSAFRVIHVDGAMGSLTPRGLIHMAVYSERTAIPQVTTHEIGSDGKLGDISTMESKEGVVREIDVDLLFTIQTAQEIRDWLGVRIEEAKKIESMVKTKEG